MNKRLVPVVVVAVAAAALGFYGLRKRMRDGAGSMRVSGNIEITEAEVSFKIPGRIASRLVSEGETVTNGQVVARLEDTELRQELALREADVRAAQALLADLEAGARPEEIEQAVAALDAAKAEAKRLDGEYARQKELFQNKVASPREFEAAQAACDTAAARVREAEARLALLKKGARSDARDAARARVEQARQGAALARTRLEQAVLAAPFAGTVLSQGAEDGEYVVPGAPVVTVGNLERVWLRAYVDETDLGRVKLGMPVTVTTDTFPGKSYEGRLSFLAQQAEFTPRTVQTAKERVKLVYRIKVDIPNETLELKPGMPADAKLGAE